MVTMGQRAEFLAGKGFAVFPLFTIDDGQCSCGKACASPGKHPIGSLVPRGCHEATTDQHLVREWWALSPDSNIGIATGDVSGLMVLDIDVETGGDESLTNLEEQFGALPETWTVWTGSGGAHFYFAMPSLDIRNSAGKVAPGIDVRGNGGYVVAPPSRHLSGNSYRWHDRWRPNKIEIAPVTDWLLNRIMPRMHILPASAPPIPNQLLKGTRNVELASAAGTMRRRGFCEDAIFAALQIENELRCRPPLPIEEVRRISRSIGRYAPESTRVLTIRDAKTSHARTS